jgi:hypothetical protein
MVLFEITNKTSEVYMIFFKKVDFSMNTKIFSLITENLRKSFDFARYASLEFNADTVIDQLPWTPVRYRKFKDAIQNELQLDSDFSGTVRTIVGDLDRRYTDRFFREIWKPRTSEYEHTGWHLAEEITKQDPKSVLDVGCGYHPFKGRIPNLIGIDPFNSCADYEVDILEYRVRPESHDHIMALGSINFNSREDLEQRFAHCVDLLMPGGRFYLRANPGITHKNGPYVDIFPWTFEIVKQFEEKYNLRLDLFKKDANNRLFFVYTKL